MLSRFPRNMERKFLKVVTVLESPFTMLHRHNALDGKKESCETGLLCLINTSNNSSEDIREPPCCIGFVIDLLIYIKKDLDLEVSLYIVKDGSYGAVYNGIWNGMVGDVVYGHADMALAA